MKRKRLAARARRFVSRGVARRALLVFADEIHVDLARRAFPNAARPLLGLGVLGSDLSPEIDVHFFTSTNGTGPSSALIHRQTGRNFAARFENAIEMLARFGYEEIVAIGRDCPALGAGDIERAFSLLTSRKLVLGPDHRGGCYLIAFRAAERALLRDIRWKRNTDCRQLQQRAGAANVFLLPIKQDLDSWNDLRLFAHGADPLARLAAFLLNAARSVPAGVSEFLSLALRRLRIRQQMPPPAVAA